MNEPVSENVEVLSDRQNQKKRSDVNPRLQLTGSPKIPYDPKIRRKPNVSQTSVCGASNAGIHPQHNQVLRIEHWSASLPSSSSVRRLAMVDVSKPWKAIRKNFARNRTTSGDYEDTVREECFEEERSTVAEHGDEAPVSEKQFSKPLYSDAENMKEEWLEEERSTVAEHGDEAPVPEKQFFRTLDSDTETMKENFTEEIIKNENRTNSILPLSNKCQITDMDMQADITPYQREKDPNEPFIFQEYVRENRLPKGRSKYIKQFNSSSYVNFCKGLKHSDKSANSNEDIDEDGCSPLLPLGQYPSDTDPELILKKHSRYSGVLHNTFVSSRTFSNFLLLFNILFICLGVYIFYHEVFLKEDKPTIWSYGYKAINVCWSSVQNHFHNLIEECNTIIEFITQIFNSFV